jgi:MoaA/NifB/PqqE/SkfB family radical SAM enzyme
MELPSFLQIEPVGECNLRCEMCPIQFRNDGPADGTPACMPFATYTRILDQFPKLEELHLQGLGEPLMHPQFFDMVAYAVARGVRVSTNTNLTVLSPRRAEQCITCGLDCIHVSIDAATPAVYEKIRVGSRFSRVLRNLDFLNRAKQRLASQRPRLRLVSVLMRQNLHELPELVRLAHRWQMESMFVQHLCHDFGEESLPATYRPMRAFVDAQTVVQEPTAHVEAVFAAARAAADELGLELRLPRPHSGGYPEETPGRERCNWPWRGMYVSYQGFSMPCCMIATPDRGNFGNLGEQPATLLWNGESYGTFRSRLASDDPPTICRSCAVYRGIF